jgi:hypothetical protein
MQSLKVGVNTHCSIKRASNSSPPFFEGVGPKEAVLFMDLHTFPIFLAHHINPHVHICIYNLYILPYIHFLPYKNGFKNLLHRKFVG